MQKTWVATNTTETKATNPTTTNQHTAKQRCTQVMWWKGETSRPNPLLSAVLLLDIELPEESFFQIAKEGIRSKCKYNPCNRGQTIPVLASSPPAARGTYLQLFSWTWSQLQSLLYLHWVIPYIRLLLPPIYSVFGVPYLRHTLLLPANPFPWCCVSIFKLLKKIRQCQQWGRLSISSLPIPLAQLSPFAIHHPVVMPTVLSFKEALLCEIIPLKFVTFCVKRRSRSLSHCGSSPIEGRSATLTCPNPGAENPLYRLPWSTSSQFGVWGLQGTMASKLKGWCRTSSSSACRNFTGVDGNWEL